MDYIPHTGIVIYDKEFYYGGGISYDLPGMTPFGKWILFVNQEIGRPMEVKELGFTEVPEDMFMELLKDIAPRFSM